MMIKESSTDKYIFGSQGIQKAAIDMKQSNKVDQTSFEQIESNFKETICCESELNDCDNFNKICNTSLA